jgi:DegV family protein with EDD domain
VPVRVVADSNCDLPPDLVSRFNILIVPSLLHLGGQVLRDGLDLSRAEFYRRLPGLNPLPTTAAPAAGEFEAAFRACGDNPIVCLTLAAAFSAIYNAARLGAEPFGQRVALIDSGTVSMAMGWQVLAAAEAAQAGAPLPAVVARVQAVQRAVRLYAVLDTLEYLRRGGRASLVRALVGDLLQVKPILEVRDGQVATRARVRTQARARADLIARAEALGPLARLAVLHTACPADAAALAARLAPQSSDPPLIVEATAVIGVHVGPRALAIAPLLRDM